MKKFMNVIFLAVTVAITAQDMDVVAACNKTHNWCVIVVIIGAGRWLSLARDGGYNWSGTAVIM